MPRFPRACSYLLTATLAASCGGSSNDPSKGDVVPGSTRIAWDQTAANASELASLHFVIYIDEVRNELPGAACTGPAGNAGFACEATLPAMSSGRHTIQLASYVIGEGLLESPKSAPLTITVGGGGAVSAGDTTASAATAGAAGPSPRVGAPSSVRDVTTRDGTKLHTAVLAAVAEPSALAIAEDGTVLVGHRAGRVSVLRGGEVTETALASDRVLDLVVDPAFTRSHLVYVLDVVAGQPATFRLARYREVNGQLGERAVVLDGVPARPDTPAGALAISTDGRLFVALDDGGDAANAARPASYNGKVLRLTVEGRTPAEQDGSLPTYAANIPAPRGLVWDSAGASLWLTETGAARATRLRSGDRRTITTSYRLPQAPASIAVYRGALIPAFAGDLLVTSSDDSPSLLRVRMAGSDAMSSTEPLTLLGSGSLRTVKVAFDGAIYVLTDDAVLRVAPSR